MAKKRKSIPVNYMIDDSDIGISIDRILLSDMHPTEKDPADAFAEGKQSHRHDSHSFYLLEAGTVSLEIDFQTYKIKPSSIIYIHPDQVHRITSLKNVTVISLAINNENLNPEYLAWLEDMVPVKPLVLQKETSSIITEAAALCIKIFDRKNDKLYHLLLKDSCNALVALFISQYLELTKSTDKLSRFEVVAKAFKEILKHNYTTVKRPAEYARQLNISVSYLNECVNNTTGYSVSHHIQQRVVLEAKRLLYHSRKSVKEIAAELGYDDYPYFSRLFTKVAGMSALAFRNKNHD